MKSPTPSPPPPPPPPPYAAKHTIITTPPAVSNRTPTSPSSSGSKLPSLDPSGHRVSTALNITFSPTGKSVTTPIRARFFGEGRQEDQPGRRHTVHRVSSATSSATNTTANVLNGATTEWKPGVCSECGVRITNAASACQALGCIYHAECFICCCCRRSLCGKTFYKDQDKIYCEEDYLYCGFQGMAEKCTVCGHIIAQTILKALGQSYHPGCFRCTICNRSMDGESFTVDQNGQIYCLHDYYLATAPTCAACAGPILPEPPSSDEVVRVVAMNKEFHIGCYRCEDCDLLLSDETSTRCYPFVENTEKGLPVRTHLLCLNCHLTRIGATPAPGQNIEVRGRRGSNGSSIASSSDLGVQVGPSSPSGVYSPTPTSYGIASIGSKVAQTSRIASTTPSPYSADSPTAYKMSKSWATGRSSYLSNDGR